jgi:phosphoribosylglycinamide formyltransferase-1
VKGSGAHPDGEFVGERIEPLGESMRVSDMLRGRPGLPMRFRWRDREFAVAEVLETWKSTGPCRSGSPEQYVRAHWYRIRTEDGSEMTLYCDRQKRRGSPRIEWRLHTVRPSESSETGA